MLSSNPTAIDENEETYFINKIIQELGWQDKIRVPPPNEQNLKLLRGTVNNFKAIQDHKMDLELIEKHLSDEKNQISKIKEELDTSRNFNKSLVLDIEGEKNLKKLAENQICSYKNDSSRMKEKETELKSKIERWSKLKQEKLLNLDKNKLDEVLVNKDVLKERILTLDDNFDVIEKHKRSDNLLIKKLNEDIVKTREILSNSEESVRMEHNNTIQNYVYLDSIANEFRMMLKEKKRIVTQWEYCVKYCFNKDKEIIENQVQLTELKEHCNETMNKLNKERKLRDNISLDNNAITKNLDDKQREKVKLKQELEQVKNEKDEFCNELLVVELSVRKLSKELQQTQVGLRTTIQMHGKIMEEIKVHFEERLKLSKTLEKVENDELDYEDKLKEIEFMHSNQQKHFDKVLRKNDIANAKKFKVCNQLFIEKKNEFTLENKVQGLKMLSKNVSSRVELIGNTLLDIQDQLVTLEFQYQHLQGQKLVIDGYTELSVESELRQTEKIEGLNAKIADCDDRLRTCSEQIKKQSTENNSIKKQLLWLTGQQEKLTLTRDQVDIYTENSIKFLEKLSKQKSSLKVELSLLKAKHDIFEKKEASSRTALKNVEHVNIKSKYLFKERNVSIEKQKGQLLKNLKLILQDLSKLKVEHSLKQVEIKKAKLKYEAFLTKVPGETDSNTEFSQNYFIIEAGKMMQSLKAQGGKLDLQIQKAEKELMALANTVNIVCYENLAIKKSYAPKEDSMLEETQKQLQKQFGKMLKEAVDRKKIIAEYSNINEEKANLNLYYSEKCNDCKESMNDVEKLVSNLRRELTSIKIKYNRAKQLSAKLKYNLEKTNPKSVKDIETRFFREFLRVILKRIFFEIHHLPEFEQIHKDFFQAGFKIC